MKLLQTQYLTHLRNKGIRYSQKSFFGKSYEIEFERGKKTIKLVFNSGLLESKHIAKKNMNHNPIKMETFKYNNNGDLLCINTKNFDNDFRVQTERDTEIHYDLKTKKANYAIGKNYKISSQDGSRELVSVKESRSK